jgi:hypothetical protein
MSDAFDQRDLQCCCDGDEYLVRIVRADHRALVGRRTQAMVLMRPNAQADWDPVSMKLTINSRVKHSLYRAWPPESVDDLSCVNGQLTMMFRDHWNPYFVENTYEWRATLNSKKGAWILSRLRRLDYDGTDVPP